MIIVNSVYSKQRNAQSCGNCEGFEFEDAEYSDYIKAVTAICFNCGAVNIMTEAVA